MRVCSFTLCIELHPVAQSDLDRALARLVRANPHINSHFENDSLIQSSSEMKSIDIGETVKQFLERKSAAQAAAEVSSNLYRQLQIDQVKKIPLLFVTVSNANARTQLAVTINHARSDFCTLSLIINELLYLLNDEKAESQEFQIGSLTDYQAFQIPTTVDFSKKPNTSFVKFTFEKQEIDERELHNQQLILSSNQYSKLQNLLKQNKIGLQALTFAINSKAHMNCIKHSDGEYVQLSCTVNRRRNLGADSVFGLFVEPLVVKVPVNIANDVVASAQYIHKQIKESLDMTGRRSKASGSSRSKQT